MTQKSPPGRMALTVGPLQYWWPRQQIMQAYAEWADGPADCFVLGEVTCSRRNEFSLADWLALARDLQACGKTVRLATLPLVMSEAELRSMRRIAEQGEFAVEAGDTSALRAWSRQAGGEGDGDGPRTRPALVLGPHLNIYNAAALAEHLQPEVSTWVAPMELGLQAVACISPRAREAGVSTEMMGFGRMTLAFSARCFTARHHRLSKDQCEFRCRDDADGLLLRTGEGQAFLALNGIATQSASVHCLIDAAADLRAAGVGSLRLSPCSQGFAEVLSQFEQVFNQGAGKEQAALAWQRLRELPLPGALVQGFAHQQAGMRELARVQEQEQAHA